MDDTLNGKPSTSRRGNEDGGHGNRWGRKGRGTLKSNRNYRPSGYDSKWNGSHPGGPNMAMDYGFDPSYGQYKGEFGDGYWDPNAVPFVPFESQETGEGKWKGRQTNRSDSGWPDRGKGKWKAGDKKERESREREEGTEKRERTERKESMARSEDEDSDSRARRIRRAKRRRKSAGLDSEDERQGRIERIEGKRSPWKGEVVEDDRREERRGRERATSEQDDQEQKGSRRGSESGRSGDRRAQWGVGHREERERRAVDRDQREDKKRRETREEEESTNGRGSKWSRSDRREEREARQEKKTGSERWGQSGHGERRDRDSDGGSSSVHRSSSRSKLQYSSNRKRDNGWARRQVVSPEEESRHQRKGEERGGRDRERRDGRGGRGWRDRERDDERGGRREGEREREGEKSRGGEKDRERDGERGGRRERDRSEDYSRRQRSELKDSRDRRRMTSAAPSTPPRRQSPEAQILRRREGSQRERGPSKREEEREEREERDRAVNDVEPALTTNRPRPGTTNEADLFYGSDSDRAPRSGQSRWVKVSGKRVGEGGRAPGVEEGPSNAMQAAMQAALSLPTGEPVRDASEVVEGREEDKMLPRLIRARPDEVYEQVAQVGEGTYGQVFKAKSDKTGVVVALKKIRMESEKDGFPITAMREIKLLQGLRHENIVRLHEMMLSRNSIYMVFEYLQHDLNGILAQPSIEFEESHLKSLAQQLLSGLAYLHHHSILHRDLKGSNLLVNSEGTLKLADFGLARRYTKRSKTNVDYTNRVVTLWYRPPELLFGETCYKDAIDVWGAGCIFIELFTRKPLFQGQDEIHQVHLLFDILGPISKHDWPDVDTLPWYDLVRPAESDGDDEGKVNKGNGATCHRQRLENLFGSQIPSDALDLAAALLSYNPARRLSAADALRTDYFVSKAPRPEKPRVILQKVMGEWHEFESRQAKRLSQQQQQQSRQQGDRNTFPDLLAKNGRMGPPEAIHC